MTRRRFRKQAVSPSLFPFLAVLVCTMGALIVLLVLVVQQARVYATNVADSRNVDSDEVAVEDDEREQQQLAYDDYAWQREIFEQQRADLTSKLSERRFELSHLEDHIRRLEDEWQRMKRQAEALQNLESQKAATREQSLAELDKLRTAIDEAKQRLEAARHEAATKPKTFAIIPYDGVNGTKRRPIYIECTEEGIAIQPEGIVLRRGDLEGPLGPGNPLDAALRATREHWARLGDTATNGEPYPLLIVRPNGTLAYNYAREALKAWDDEFGYELIDAEMQLEYPASDGQLHDLLQRTVQRARERQAILVAAMPSQFEQQGSVGGYVATPSRGGFRPVGRGGSAEGIASGFAGPGQSGSESFVEGQGDASFRVENDASIAGASTSGNPSEQSSRRAGQNENGSEQTGQGSGAESAETGTGGPNSRGGANGPGGTVPMAGQRGANWGVPKASAGATAYQVPVRIVCSRDLLVILPRPSDNLPAVEVPATDPLSRSVDNFVKLMWKQIDQWDAAPVGGYWQPVLEVYVHPGAEGRFMELKSLLSGSGIQVQRQAQ